MSIDWERAALEISDDGDLRARRHGTPGPVVEVGAGGSLPDWWEVDSTPGSESVTFAGQIIVTPNTAVEPAIFVEAPAEYVDTLAYGTMFGARMAGGSGDWGDDFVYKLGVGTMYYKSAPNEGAATFAISAADTDGESFLSDGTLAMYEEGFNGDTSKSAQLTPRFLQLYKNEIAPSPGAGQIYITYDADDADPALVITASTEPEGNPVSARISLTP